MHIGLQKNNDEFKNEIYKYICMYDGILIRSQIPNYCTYRYVGSRSSVGKWARSQTRGRVFESLLGAISEKSREEKRL